MGRRPGCRAWILRTSGVRVYRLGQARELDGPGVEARMVGTRSVGLGLPASLYRNAGSGVIPSAKRIPDLPGGNAPGAGRDSAGPGTHLPSIAAAVHDPDSHGDLQPDHISA